MYRKALHSKCSKPTTSGTGICIVQAQRACSKCVGDKNPPILRIRIWWPLFYLIELAGTQTKRMLTALATSMIWLATGSALVDLGNTVLVPLSWTQNLRMMGWKEVTDELKNEAYSDCSHCHCCLFCSEYLPYLSLHGDLHAISVCPGLPLFKRYKGMVL